MTWQRVESATIDVDLDHGLEARVADPMWLLARQWQVGEFRGEDAAIPVFVTLRARSVELSHVQPGPPAGDGRIVARHAGSPPLEAAIEAEPLTDVAARERWGAELGELLLAALRDDQRIGAGPYRTIVAALQEKYGADVPAAPSGGDREPDPVGRRRLRLLARRSFDASDLVEQLLTEPADVATWIASIDVSDRARRAFVEIGAHWARALATTFVGPLGDGAWSSARMEYEGSVGAALDDAGSGIALALRDHGGGRLDWYGFDYLGAKVAPDADGTTTPAVRSYVSELVPQPLTFAGMPASRFWEIEDAEVHFGGIDAAPEDLAKLSLAAYATVYGDDWYVVPLTVAAGSIVTIDEVVVVDDFSTSTEVSSTTIPSAAVRDGPDRAFRWFELTGDPSTTLGREPVLFVPPTVDTSDAGRLLDDVRITRDEMANTAWAIERRVLDASGRAVDPLALAGRAPSSAAPIGGEDDGVWSFRIGGEVPSNWVPMVPVRLGQGGAVGLQRGRMPLPGGGTRGATGDLLEPDRRLVVEESEVPVAGLRVVRRFQSARSMSGGFHVWLGRQKGPGRGEGDSGLVFDQLRM